MLNKYEVMHLIYDAIEERYRRTMKMHDEYGNITFSSVAINVDRFLLLS